ncbi:MAG: hypothetical protein WC120_04735 [Parcubacteria group bacterium]
MMIKSITITCPDCKKEFTGTKILSFNTFNGPPDFSDESFASTRKCPGCGKAVDATDKNNWIYTPEPVLPMGQKIKRFLGKFLP